jgi:hypothetical protein
MSVILKVRVKRSGRHLHEQPVSLASRNHLPNVGDFIEIPIDGEIIRAYVTLTSPPICRSNDSVMYVVYADEATDVTGLVSPSTPGSHEDHKGSSA